MSWDAIIIGSGLGGLTTGSLLARAGKKVLILEKHTVPGGFTHTFSRKGFEWDVGVHYVGQIGDPNAMFRKVFDYVTDKQVDWAPMDSVYDKAIIEGETYDFVAGVENQKQNLFEIFPDDKKAIEKYYRLVQSTGTSAAWFFGEKTMPPFLSLTIGWLLRWKFAQIAKKTTYEVLSSLTKNEKLISVLCTQCGDYGLTPKKSSFGIHAVVVEHYLNGAAYPVGGARKIHEALVSSIEQRGGRVLVKKSVDEILIEKNRITGVRVGDDIFTANVVISNAGVFNTFKKLLPKATLPFDVHTPLNEVKASTAHICLYVGLDASDKELRIPKHNYWIYDKFNFDEAFEEGLQNPGREPALTYISFPSAKDPDWEKNHPAKATVQIIAPMPFDWFQKWENTKWKKRGEDYEAKKAEWSARLLERLYRVEPSTRGHVEYAELSTPLSTKHFMNYQHGEIYGLEHTPQRFGLKWLRPQTPIRGLFLTGQDIVSVGIGGALFSGVLTASVVLNKFLMLKILRNKPLA